MDAVYEYAIYWDMNGGFNAKSVLLVLGELLEYLYVGSYSHFDAEVTAF